MDRIVLLVFLVVALVAIGLSIWRSVELFALRVDKGNVRIVRGRLPKSLLSEVRDVFGRSQETGTVRVTVVRRVATVNVSGAISDATVQRLRNVIGAVPLQRIRSGDVR